MSEYLTLAALQLDDPHANRPAATADFTAPGPVNTAGPIVVLGGGVRGLVPLWVGLGGGALSTLVAVLLSLLGS